MQYNAGDVIADRYVLERPLGSGGLAVVWAARQKKIDRLVAIKFLKQTGTDRDRTRFEYEARALGKLDHPSCVTIHDFGETDDGAPFLVMQFLDGQSLDRMVGEPLPIELVLEVARGVAKALEKAHALEIVHRDLKPGNIFLVDEEQDRVKVLDFGLAKMSGRQQVTQDGVAIGTPRYMSPEQLCGDADLGPSADLYSLGVTLFELIEGEPPFNAPNYQELAAQHIREPAPPVSRDDCPRTLAQLVHQLLAKEAEGRPGSATDLLRRLDEVERELTVEVRDTIALRTGPTSADETLERELVARARSTERTVKRSPAPRSPLTTVAAGAVGLVLVAGAVMLASEDDDPTEGPALVVKPLASPDAGTNHAAASASEVEPGDERIASGCGADSPAGTSELPVHTATTESQALIVVPQAYDGQVGAPLVALLHDTGQGAAGALQETALSASADEHGFLLVVPQANGEPAWEGDDDLALLQATITMMRERYCVDESRVFAIGHGRGGHQVERLACDLPVFAAIAATATRGATGQRWCDRPIPYLHLASLRDAYNPVEGGTACDGVRRISLEQHESQWQRRNTCKSDRHATRRFGASVCYSWTCTTALTSCHIDGGRHWPSVAAERIEADPCDVAPADFPFGDVIWRFFETVGPRRDVTP